MKKPKTTRRRGVKRTLFPFYPTPAAQAFIDSIPNGQKAQEINKAIEQYAKDPTKRKEDK